jgi:hypothetical protein
MENSVENGHIKFWMEDGILHGFYKKGCILSLKAAKEVVEMRLKYQQGEGCKALMYITHISAITPEAKEYLSKEGSEGIEQAALVSSSLFTIFLGNLYIKLNKPISPTRLFKEKKDAVEWLKSKEVLNPSFN